MNLSNKECAEIARYNVEHYTEKELDSMVWFGSASGAVMNYKRCRKCYHFKDDLRCEVFGGYCTALYFNYNEGRCGKRKVIK